VGYGRQAMRVLNIADLEVRPPGERLQDDLIVGGDNARVLALLPEGAFDMIYIDPPFNTGARRSQQRLSVAADEQGDRRGFAGRRYRSELLSALAYDDRFADYLAFLEPRLRRARELLAAHGTLYFHIDYREAHYCKLLLDEIFGRACFLNEIIWAYDYGGRPRRRWPAKHDTILVYVKDPERYHFDSAEVEREPYMAPGLVTAAKAARGKLPTDCYSADTDVLTRRGWIGFPELRGEDELATVSPDSEMHYATPVKLHRHRHRGDLLRFVSRTVDLLVTPQHTMFVRPKHSLEYEFRAAVDLAHAKSTYYALPNRLRWMGYQPPDQFYVPPVKYLRAYCAKPLPPFELGDWCEFMGWYLAEGCTSFHHDCCETIISQQKRPERVARIGALLKRMGLRARYDGRAFIIANKQLATYLRGFGKAGDKYIPRELLDLPAAYLERLRDGLMLGDGYVRQRGVGEEALYATVSPRLAADVQELFIKLGHNANVTFTDHGKKTWRRRYHVSRRTARESTVWPDRHQEVVRYEGDVFCATVVPYHTLVVRRNGKAAVCGNCWWHTIVPTASAERTGYPTQKPEGIVRRMVAASSRPGGWCLDFFAGSGTLGAVCATMGRRFVLIDDNPEAIEVMKARLGESAAGATPKEATT
jgi:site-specific DNA-methyltransferase (adenine-specific)